MACARPRSGRQNVPQEPGAPRPEAGFALAGFRLLRLFIGPRGGDDAPRDPQLMSDAPAPRRFLHPGVSLALRIALVVALFAFMATRIDLREMASAVAHADRRFLALAFLALVASQLTAAWRWHLLLLSAGSRWTFGQSLATYGAGLFLSLFLPTGLGGDVYRIAKVRNSGAGLGRGAATILLERAIGLVALLLLGTAFVASHPATRPWAVLFGVGALGGLVGIALLWIPGGPEYVARLADKLGKAHLGDRVRNAFPADAMDRLRGAIPGTIVLSLANHAWLLLVNVLLAIGLGVALPWTAICAAVPIVLLAAQIPITPGGTGVREAAYLFFLGRVGVPHPLALAIALGWLAVLAVVSLLGAIGFLFERSAALVGANENGRAA